MKMIKHYNKEAATFGGAIIVATILLLSTFLIVIPSGFAGSNPFPQKIIAGHAEKCNGNSANGASVTVTALDPVTNPIKTTTVGGTSWQVDVSNDPDGPPWPDGTDFTVDIEMGDWSGGATDTVDGSFTDVGWVYLDPPTLSATASASPTTIVAGESVGFTGSATGGATPYSWFWDFDGDGTDTQQNPTHTFNSQGIYDCELTVTDDCYNTDTDNVIITVNPALDCDAGGPYSGNICNCVQFDGTASGGHGGNSFSWDFDDSDGIQVDSTQEDPCFLYDSDGSYTATLTVTDSESDIATDTATVTISTTSLTADAGGPYSGTVCEPVSFSGSASGGCSPYTYSWDFGDGGSGSGQYTSHQYDSDYSYTVTLTVNSDNGDSDQDTATVTISTDPLVVDADGPYSEVTGNPIEFEGSANGGCDPYTWSWDFGDGETSYEQNPIHSYDDDGEYTVILTVTDDVGVVETDETTASIEPAEVIADAGGPYYGAVGEPIEFSGSASVGQPPYSYFWDFGDGNMGSGQNPTHTYDEPNDDEGYDVVLTVTDANGYSDWDTTKAFVSGSADEVHANAHGPYSGYVDEDIQFTGSAFGGSEPYSYSWDFGDGNTSDEQNPIHQYTSVGTYDITLTVTDDEGDSGVDTTTASIEEEPLISDLVCSGSLTWSGVKSGAETSSSFVVANEGDAGSLLDWSVVSYPDWGTWTFTPSSGSDLTPGDGEVMVNVSVVAPTVKSKSLLLPLAANEEEYTGEVVIGNSEDSSDMCVVTVSMVVPRNHVEHPWLQLFWQLIERFPMLEMIFTNP